MPVSFSASGRFGVTIIAIGTMMLFTASTASASSRESPLCATITGSTTSFFTPSSESPSATALIAPRLPSIPVFTASSGKSRPTARICAFIISGGTGWIPVTPTEFCTVTAVIADVPKTLSEAKVFKSA